MKEPSNSPHAISLDEFKARLPIVEIVGRHVRLVRRGREFTGLCPFHREKTPSFTVSEEKGFYHCFGCNQNGNAVDFIMAIEGLDFGQAIQRLADLTGLPPPLRAAARSTRAEKTLYDANDAATRWFQERLAGAEGAEARAYLEGRGLDAAIIGRLRPRLRADGSRRPSPGPAVPRLQGVGPGARRPSDPARRRRLLRPFSPARDVPDPGCQGPGDRLWRPGAGRGARQISEHAGNRAVSQG
ncbi:MAG: hypothetical protein HC871_17655 [Rhizobiales bacterium]|nr:hypothetical protein [Hyphomicrobiales bacterium]